MASALARGLGEPVLVSDLDGERARALAAELSAARRSARTRELAERADVVVLCHKPTQLEEVAGERRGQRKRGRLDPRRRRRTDAIEDAYPGVPVYRFIPNIPAEVGRGVLCYAPGSRAADGPERRAARAVRPRRAR